MIAFKQTIVQKMALSPAQPVHPVAVDFSSQSFVRQLSLAGYTPARSAAQAGETACHQETLFVIEGLINYLSDDKAEELLEAVAHSFPGAFVALTSRLAPPPFSDEERRRRREVDAQLHSVGEPHQFAMPRDVDSFFTQRGFTLVDQLMRPLANLRAEVSATEYDYGVFLLKVGV